MRDSADEESPLTTGDSEASSSSNDAEKRTASSSSRMAEAPQLNMSGSAIHSDVGGGGGGAVSVAVTVALAVADTAATAAPQKPSDNRNDHGGSNGSGQSQNGNNSGSGSGGYSADCSSSDASSSEGAKAKGSSSKSKEAMSRNATTSAGAERQKKRSGQGQPMELDSSHTGRSTPSKGIGVATIAAKPRKGSKTDTGHDRRSEASPESSMLPQFNGFRITHLLDPRIDLSTVKHVQASSVFSFPHNVAVPTQTLNDNTDVPITDQPMDTDEPPGPSIDQYASLMEVVKPFFEFNGIDNITYPPSDVQEEKEQLPSNTAEAMATSNGIHALQSSEASSDHAATDRLKEQQRASTTQRGDDSRSMDSDSSSMVVLARVKRKHIRKHDEEQCNDGSNTSLPGSSNSSSTSLEKRSSDHNHEQAVRQSDHQRAPSMKPVESSGSMRLRDPGSAAGCDTGDGAAQKASSGSSPSRNNKNQKNGIDNENSKRQSNGKSLDPQDFNEQRRQQHPQQQQVHDVQANHHAGARNALNVAVDVDPGVGNANHPPDQSPSANGDNGDNVSDGDINNGPNPNVNRNPNANLNGNANANIGPDAMNDERSDRGENNNRGREQRRVPEHNFGMPAVISEYSSSAILGSSGGSNTNGPLSTSGSGSAGNTGSGSNQGGSSGSGNDQEGTSSNSIENNGSSGSGNDAKGSSEEVSGGNTAARNGAGNSDETSSNQGKDHKDADQQHTVDDGNQTTARPTTGQTAANTDQSHEGEKHRDAEREKKLQDKKRKRMNMRREYEEKVQQEMGSSEGSRDMNEPLIRPGRPTTLDKALSFTKIARVIVKANSPYVVIYTNAAYTRLSGVDAHSAVGKPLSNLIAVPSDEISQGLGLPPGTAKAKESQSSMDDSKSSRVSRPPTKFGNRRHSTSGQDHSEAAATGRTKAESSKSESPTLALDRLLTTSANTSPHSILVAAKPHIMMGRNVTIIKQSNANVNTNTTANRHGNGSENGSAPPNDASRNREEGSNESSSTYSYDGSFHAVPCTMVISPVVSSPEAYVASMHSDKDSESHHLHHKSKRRKHHGHAHGHGKSHHHQHHQYDGQNSPAQSHSTRRHSHSHSHQHGHFQTSFHHPQGKEGPSNARRRQLVTHFAIQLEPPEGNSEDFGSVGSRSSTSSG